MKKQILFDFLTEHQLPYQLHEHEPIFTVEEGKHISAEIEGAHSKNLFLKDKKRNFFLVSILEHKRLDLKSFSKMYGKGGLSFAGPEELDEKLKLTPGSVTPYGLLNDLHHEVCFVLDEDFLSFELVNFHPLQNDLTVSMPIGSFLRFFQLIQHQVHIIQIPTL